MFCYLGSRKLTSGTDSNVFTLNDAFSFRKKHIHAVYVPFHCVHSSNSVCASAFSSLASHMSVDIMKFRELNDLLFVTFPIHNKYIVL